MLRLTVSLPGADNQARKHVFAISLPLATKPKYDVWPGEMTSAQDQVKSRHAEAHRRSRQSLRQTPPTGGPMLKAYVAFLG